MKSTGREEVGVNERGEVVEMLKVCMRGIGARRGGRGRCEGVRVVRLRLDCWGVIVS